MTGQPVWGVRRSADAAPRIVFVSISNDIGGERVVAEMASNGVECGIISPKGFNCTLLKCISRHWPIPNHYGVRFGTLFIKGCLSQVVQEWFPDLILPLDDTSAWLLRSLATDRSVSVALRDRLEMSLGEPSSYPAAICRLEFMNAAQALNLRKPHHCEVTSRESAFATAEEWGYPLVIKAEHTSGGAGIAIVRNAQDLSDRLRWDFGKWFRQTVKTQIYNLAGFHDAGRATVMLQSYVPGTPAFRNVAAWKGQILTGVSFIAEQVHPEPTGASTVIRQIENVEMDQAASRITAALGFSGFVSYDFIVDRDSGAAWLIEVNSRCTGSTHLGRLWDLDVCGALSALLKGTSTTPLPSLIRPAAVALFPKELERDPESFYVRSPAVYHDVPVDEPHLLSAYRRRLEKVDPRFGEGLAWHHLSTARSRLQQG